MSITGVRALDKFQHPFIIKKSLNKMGIEEIFLIIVKDI